MDPEFTTCLLPYLFYFVQCSLSLSPSPISLFALLSTLVAVPRSDAYNHNHDHNHNYPHTTYLLFWSSRVLDYARNRSVTSISD
ncbi:hypothetical protein F4809DRAFT_371204 [Biscogniauxia mediterranea]|nr:hypothetical protein F4809DRAFT_371204 [Biscogniauxia mediterranea]